MAIIDPPVRARAADEIALSAQLEYSIDYNNAARVIVETAVGEVPVVGVVLGAMVAIFWPDSGVDVWDEIKDQVEEVVDEKISQQVWQNVSNSLAGLNNVLDDYVHAVQTYKNDPQVISEKWNTANALFLHDLPSFQSAGYEVLLLPLFAQFANMHLSLLRDGGSGGGEWGWSSTVVDDVKHTLSRTVEQYGEYASAWYDQGYQQAVDTAPSNSKKTEPFNSVNGYVREMTLTVLDFSILWPLFDLETYPDGGTVNNDREIYSDVVGTADDTGVHMPQDPPTEPLTSVTVWGWDRIDAAKVDYPEGGGPDGQTSTGRMGNSNGGSKEPPHGGTFTVAEYGDIVEVKSLAGDVMTALWFGFEDGSMTYKLGGNYGGGQTTIWSYPDEILSSIKIMGVSRYYGSANAAVFGFKFKDPDGTLEPEMMRLAYVNDPGDSTPSQLAAKLGLKPEQGELMERLAKEYRWDAVRAAGRARRARRIKARARRS